MSMAKSVEVSGPAQFAARAKSRPEDDVWFTVGQGWAYEDDDGTTGVKVTLTMVPTKWDGELLLVPIPPTTDESAY
jgi:hypothetical protein